MPEPSDASASAHGVPFRDAVRFWVKLGFINFGGPTGQIAIMHDEIVERRKWISNGTGIAVEPLGGPFDHRR